jgi:hypothetical protein
MQNEKWADQFQPMRNELNMGESIGLRNLVQEIRVELAIRDLRGLMRGSGLLERTLLRSPEYENKHRARVSKHNLS